ncbi:hypothetical protein BDV98DRAFT_592273 [Pterulicium gracile]|uniref:Zn(2)-C6 fungal-type domain-containing protein n=1 Tax=Pterulicium gracile TaxID=1884261 RepID=A0A5C3QQN6_9AGAR|nr:hypothetical protein BDV98DRAFT_592273 [Pterula gracilis]
MSTPGSVTPPSMINRRGTACFNCRKVKCDIQKPACGPCVRASMGDDCQFADSGPSRTRALKRTIAQLQSRVVELEGQAQPSSQPAAGPSYEGMGYDQGAPVVERDSRNCPASRPLTAVTLSSFPSTSGSSSASPNPTLAQYQEPPHFFRRILLHHFLHHADQVGFFLHGDQFRESVLLQASYSDHRRPTASLLAVVYLWGIVLSQSEDFLAYEPEFLSVALQLVPTAQSHYHPMKTMYAIQSSLLLATYFFHSGRLQEGQEQTRIATSLVFDNGLHIARPPVVLTGLEGEGSLLRRQADEAMLSSAVWTSVRYCKTWTAALGYPSSFSYNDPAPHITLPWPSDAAAAVHSTPGSGSTLNDFLTGVHGGNTSLQALSVKASVLFERATRLFAQSPTFSAPHEHHTSLPAFMTLDNLITQVQNALPTILRDDPITSAVRVGLCELKIALRARCNLDSALGKLGHSERHELCQFYHGSDIIVDASTLHSLVQGFHPDVSYNALESLTTAMSALPTHSCPLFKFQLLRLQERQNAMTNYRTL